MGASKRLAELVAQASFLEQLQNCEDLFQPRTRIAMVDLATFWVRLARSCPYFVGRSPMAANHTHSP